MREDHLNHRVGWLRASVLGANDGIISTASLILGVVKPLSAPGEILLISIAGLVAGAMSMAAGEYVSVSAQLDLERADTLKEKREISQDPKSERDELAQIYVGRGLSPALAKRVAFEMMAKDALGAHLRDELGLTKITGAQPVQAAFASAVSFMAGASVPVVLILLAPMHLILESVAIGSVAGLALLGILGSKAGGGPIVWPTLRIIGWGVAAMVLTATIGKVIGPAIG